MREAKFFPVDPRQDEEAGIVHDEVQVALSLISRPADDLIARLYFPGTRAEAERGDDVASGAHEVAQLRAGHELMPEVMMTFDIRIPQERVGSAEHWIDLQRGKVDTRDGGWLENRLFDVGIGPVGDGFRISRWGGVSEILCV
jgi:hypothetical protein